MMSVLACVGSRWVPVMSSSSSIVAKFAVVALAQTSAPVARAALAEIATGDGDVEARARAAEAIGGNPEYKDALMSLLGHEDKQLRAAAATGLGGHKDKPIVRALIEMATTDKEGEVRAAALVAVKSSGASKAQEMVCTAMLEDESPAVRKAAVRSVFDLRLTHVRK